MSMTPKRWTAVVAAVALVGVSSGIATAAGVSIPVVNPTNGDVPFEQHVAPTSAADSGAVAVLSEKSNALDAATIQQLRDRLGADTDSPTLAEADFDAARAVTVAGRKVFVIPSGEKVCLIQSSEPDVLAGTCSSVEAITRGKAFVLTPLSSRETRVVALVADGQPGPTIVAADGTRSQMPVNDNIAAAVLDSSGSLAVADQTIPLAPPPAAVR
jgi:hypothetical protein